MDPDLEKLLRAVQRFLPILIPIAIIALPAILRAMTQRARTGQGGPMPMPDRPPAQPDARPPGDPEDDLVAQVRRMLEQRQGVPQTPPSAQPASARTSVSRVPKPRIPTGASENEVEARGIAQRGDPPAPPVRRRERPRRETSPEGRRPSNRPLKQRPATEYVQPTIYQSAAEQKDARQAAKVPAAGAVPVPVAVRVSDSAGQELAEAIARNPLHAILAAEVFGPCRAASEIGEGPTSPIGLRGS